MAQVDDATGSAPAKKPPPRRPKPVKPKPKPKKGPVARAAEVSAAAARAKAMSAADKARADQLVAAARKKAAQTALWNSLRIRAHNILAPGMLDKARSQGTLPGRKGLVDQQKAIADSIANRYKAATIADTARQKRAAAFELVKKAKAGDPNSAKALESLIREARARQAASGGTSLDKELIDAVDKAYEKHVITIANQYKKQIDTLISEKIIDKNGNLVNSKNQDALKRLAALWKSPAFKSLQSEYTRLFGTQGKPGSVSAWAAERDKIASEQRRYLYEAAKATVFKQIDASRKLGPQGVSTITGLMSEWDKGRYDEIFGDAAKADIDPSKTSLKIQYDAKTNKMTAIPRTVDEEFQYRRSQYLTEMKNQYQQYLQRQELLRVQERQLQKEMSSPENRQSTIDRNLIAQSIAATGVKDVSRPEDLQRVVSDSVATWESNNMRFFFTKEQRAALAAGGRAAEFVTRTSNYQKYLAAKNQAEKRFYAVLGANPPGFLDTVMSFGPLKGALNVIGAPIASIGAGGRVLLKAGTGSSKSFDVDLSDLPEEVKKKLGLGGPLAGLLDISSQLPFGAAPAKSAIINAWLATPEGKKWYQAEAQRHRDQAQKEDVAFNEGFYGQGDFMQKLEALNLYGNSPSTSALTNLSFGLLFDPANAVPLKFTTWLARARYATSATQDVNGLKQAFLGVKNWLTVSEPELRLQKYLSNVTGDLLKGVDPNLVRERIHMSLAGIKESDAAARQTEKLFRDLGLDPRLKDDHQLMTLVEEMLTQHFQRAGVDYESVASAAKKRLEEQALQDAAEKAQRSAGLAAADAHHAAREAQAKTIAEGGLTRTREKLIHEAQIKVDKLKIEKRVPEVPPERHAGDWANEWVHTGSEFARAESHVSTAARSVREAAERFHRDIQILTELRAQKLTVSDVKLRAGLNMISKAKKSGVSDLADLAGLPADIRRHAALVSSIDEARNEMLLGLSRMTRLTIGTGSLTEADAQVLSTLVDSLREVPQAKGVLEELARVQGSDLWASRLGDYLRYEPYFTTGVGVVPEAKHIQTLRVTSSQEALFILSNGLTEEKWLARELQRAERALSRNTTREGRKAAFRRKRDVQRALRVLEVAKKGGSFINYDSRKHFAKRVSAVVGERAKTVMNPASIAPYASNSRGALVEQGRAEYSVLSRAPVDENLGRTAMVGDMSQTYLTHGKVLDALFDYPLDKTLLREFGISEDMFGDLSVLDIFSNIDEFSRSLANPKFEQFLIRAQERISAKARKLTGDPKYSFYQYVSDRLNRGEHYDSRLFEIHEQGMADEIAKARGWRRNSLTDLKRVPKADATDPIVETFDNDIRVVVAKARYAKRHNLDIHRYNEARRVLRWPLVKKRTNMQLVSQATHIAYDEMKRLGLKVDDAGFASAWRKAYDDAYLLTRKDLTELEGVKKLEELASGEMFGSSSGEIIREFEARYAMSGIVKGVEPSPITLFQKRTLEDAVRTHLGVKDVYNEEEVAAALAKHGQAPPFNNRAKMKAWLTKYGVWSSRTADEIEAGRRTWSIQEEYDYYKNHWAFAPDWANPHLLEDNAKVLPKYGVSLELMKHDEHFYNEMMRYWGVFNRNMEARFATGPLTREERAKILVHGDEKLGIKPKRDVALERRYVFERFGELAATRSKPLGEFDTLTSFPWLMNREELRSYFIARAKAGISEQYVQGAEELNVLEGIAEKYIGKYFDEKAMAGQAATYEDMFTMTANIVHDMLADPVWLKRPRDRVGRFLQVQAEFRRAQVFTQIGFATTNVIDTGIKGPWTSFKTRSFRIGPASEYARGLTPTHFGLGRTTQFLTDEQLRGTKRIAEEATQPTSAHSLWGSFVGVSELPAQAAGMAETYTKTRLAQEMYDGLYQRFLKEFNGDEGLADAAARDFAGKEANRLWPTQGHGPVERLFNEISPFASYSLKNKLVFISEFMAHPALFNYLDKIGHFIEIENRKRWAQEHPNETLPDNLARLIELPWAPGIFLDVGVFSDASRGIAPLYRIAKGGMSVRDFMAQWVRLVGPNDQNFMGGILNALGFPSHMGWKPILDEKGFPTGKYEQVAVPWEAPWGGTANSLNSFWAAEVFMKYQEKSKGGFTPQEVTQLAAQMLFFGGLKEYDKGAGLNAYYWSLRDKNPDAAIAFLATADGMALQSWWYDKAGDSVDAFIPEDIKNLIRPPKGDPNPWFHSQSPEFQRQIKANLDELTLMQKRWDEKIWSLTSGTSEYREAKLQAATERYNFYRLHPEMYTFEAYSKSPADWAKTLDIWKVDALTERYYSMKAPNRDDYKTVLEWQQAVSDWKKMRSEFLRAFPQVADAIGGARTQLESVWHKTEQDWFNALDDIGVRSIAIEAAKQADDFALTEQLYLANELEGALLDKDVAVHYFDPTRDFNSLTAQLQSTGGLLSRVKILPDFNQFAFQRMDVAQKAEFERNQRYGKGMKAIIALAKVSNNFGATFVRELKKDSFLLAEYFRRNPGKREQWATTDEYIRQIGRFGRLAKAGKFDEANQYFDSLPSWVKARYYQKHPDRRQKIKQNLEYVSFMKRWVNFYKHRDYQGGAEFFAKMPKWVKDRYYSKHPNGGPGRSDRGSSPYSRALGKWVDLLQNGKKAEAKKYFDSLPQAYRDRYYTNHPEQRLRNDIKRTGQLGQYFLADDANRAQYLKDNPEFAKWLAKNSGTDAKRRMLIMAAYRAIPKEDAWMKRVFREKYPEVFSAEAKGLQSLKKTYAFLATHPDVLPAFEKWVAAVWASYAENAKHTLQPPRPIESKHQKRHQGTGRSAAWVRLHSVS